MNKATCSGDQQLDLGDAAVNQNLGR